MFIKTYFENTGSSQRYRGAMTGASLLTPRNQETMDRLKQYEGISQPFAAQLSQAAENWQQEHMPGLSSWPLLYEENQWISQSILWDFVTSQHPTEDPAIATSPQAISSYKEGSFGGGDSQDFAFLNLAFPPSPSMFINPEQSYEPQASLGLEIDSSIASPSQSRIHPPIPWFQPSFPRQDESMRDQDSITTVNNIPVVFTQGESGSNQGRDICLNHEDSKVTNGSELEDGQQKHFGGVMNELCQLEDRLQDLNKQQMSFVMDSLICHLSH